MKHVTAVTVVASRRGYTDVPGGQQVHWRHSAIENSADRPLICLHMMPKCSRDFAALLPCLGAHRPCWAPDFPGYGMSDPLAQRATVEGYASWLWQWLEAAGIAGSVDLLGYHTGSKVAVAAAAQQPDRVNRIIAISAPVFTDEELAQLNAFFQPIPLDEAGTRFQVMWERILHYRGPGVTLEMAAASLCDNLLGGEDYEEGHRAAFENNPDFLRTISALPHPLLVMNIADDLYRATQRIDPFLNNGTRRDFPEWGNGFLTLHPAEVAEVMLSFLNESGVQSP